MIEVLTSPDHVAAFLVSGTLTADNYQQIIDRVEGALHSHQRIGMYVDTLGVTGITADAIAQEVRYGLSKLGEWNRFARAAIVTDSGWVKTVVEVADSVVASVEMRVFDATGHDEALAWASEVG